MMADRKSRVQVAVRIRPLGSHESHESVAKAPAYPVVLVPAKKKQFTYDFVFDDTASDHDVYAPVQPLVQSFLQGYNATVFAYGQTGAGKTHSMGSDGVNVRGIIPLALAAVFKAPLPAATACYVTFCEIYGDDVRDLFSRQTLDRATDQLSAVAVASAAEATRCLLKGSGQRTTGGTKMNASSSRSHAIFTLHWSSDGRQTKFHFVDLAGSERQKRTLAEGLRFKEGVNINKGLLALGNVLNALSEKKAHVPYRESKLTRMLQEALGGNSQTLMLACVSPGKRDLTESVNSLEYAQRTRKICNVLLSPAPADDPRELRRHLERVLIENRALQDQLALLTAQQPSGLGLSVAWAATPARTLFIAAAELVWNVLLQAATRLERVTICACVAVSRHPRARQVRQELQRHPTVRVWLLWVANAGAVVGCTVLFCVDLVCPSLLSIT
ncbi:hypothetical protein ACHHYP_03133 [Achlya hypogyna]|uniref:Kinesin-like protein n=1 Tax=Achlya hypogyna TaxID=1202772 RepID=A0A1V9Z4L2_ACHHY|nr:hypothetical protein ACHHYP_03133 [Achlya hypogyna]